MKAQKFLISCMVVVLFFVAGFVLIKSPPAKNIYVKIAGQVLKVELATTSEEQARGLSARQGLAEDEGMLFVFDRPSKYHFWMKDMNFAIDIIWLSEDMHMIYIKKNAEPSSYPETFVPNQNAKYVLEVVSGFSDKNNLKEGDILEFLP